MNLFEDYIQSTMKNFTEPCATKSYHAIMLLTFRLQQRYYHAKNRMKREKMFVLPLMVKTGNTKFNKNAVTKMILRHAIFLQGLLEIQISTTLQTFLCTWGCAENSPRQGPDA